MPTVVVSLASLVVVLCLSLLVVVRRHWFHKIGVGPPVYSPVPRVHSPNSQLEDFSIEYMCFDPLAGPVTKEVAVNEVVRLAILEGRSLVDVKVELGISDDALLALVEMVPDWLKAGEHCGSKEN